MKRKSVCIWIEDDYGNWVTDCDHLFEQTSGTPVDNEYKYCMFCGRVLKEKKEQR